MVSPNLAPAGLTRKRCGQKPLRLTGQWVNSTLAVEAGGLVPMTVYLGREDDALIPIAGDELILERSSIGAEDSGWTRLIGKRSSVDA